MSEILVSVLVLNYHGCRFLPQLLAHLQQQTVDNFELIFIDNASYDGSVALVEQLCTECNIPHTVVQNTTNLGFAPACNQGNRLARGQWLALLNNDAWPEPQWLETLLVATKHDSKIGMVASKMLFAHNPIMINSCGIALDWMGIAWDWRGGETDDPTENALLEIFGPCGGAGLYSRAMLAEIGGFDDDFFVYLEDVDIAWRARLAGWQAVFQPQARVYHAHSATLGEGSPFKHFLLARNKVWLLTKNYPAKWLVPYLPLIFAYDLLATIYGGILRRNFALARGRLAGLQGLGKMLAKRKEIQRRWHDVDNWRSVMSPVELPWKVSQRYSHLRTTNSKAKSM